ncbi:MAG: hypothetical protein CLLPBCKN_007078 [Chroococcidiopsis cubana SAG 39.79]|uniref:Uncharacterized protein n=1 Tax=Chroococcidiopsis cubana SAG 39.79 TaxID=388085 RepID=A0AB37UBL2_9CYAN|nr:hypothetical protein [Chroococcidiopsis cubana]MDZ4877643.1 hypothetical protein [Chroococcidiopsis cubana SAG 39.79]PSB54626.1 hypothetical protein C7B79_34595 [Chroococcidiopsis cubana CCALA 043]RUT04542.1 hypothetical protein DSM107010_57220 [Chroococcidiopsis cubana SAG 39.79]
MISQQLVANESTSLVESSESAPLVESGTSIAIEATQADTLIPLNSDEQRDRERLELKVELAFRQAGKALAELKDKRLYRSTHKTFEQYCRDRFDLSSDAVYLKINAAKVYDNIEEFLPTIGRQIPMPTRERQLRDIGKAGMEPKEQADVWAESVDEAGGGLPSSSIVNKVIKRRKQKPLLPVQDECQVGNIFVLVGFKGQEKKYNDCWAVATELTDSTVTVEVDDRTLIVKPENLKKIDSPDVQQQILEILQRIRRLRKVNPLDRGADNLLKNLVKQTDLTPVEEGLLSWIENYYRVED